MIKNYLKVAFRNLVRNKAHTFINMAGLSVGLACSLLILLWVQNELGMDAFHKNGKSLFTVYERQYYDNKVNTQYYTPGVLAAEMKRVIPEIQYATNAVFYDEHTFKVGDKVLKIKGGSADADFFKMFSFPLVQGNAQSALSNPLGISISQKMALDFFGSGQEAMGKTIRLDNRKDFVITSVFENVGANSSIKFDYLVNWSSFLEDNPWAKEWGNNTPFTYVQLRADASPDLVNKKITHLLENLDKSEKKGTFTQELALQRFGETYLHGTFTNGKVDGGRIGYVNLFSIVAIFILLIACINFMNLTTARSVKRAKEIGVRKVVGALRSVLIKQFISESILLTSIAVVVALVLLVVLLPAFNQVTQKQIKLPFSEASFWLKLVLITLITGIISGSYPALFLSSFNPVKVLKGGLKLDSGTTLFRKGLVVFQFVLSVVLIIGTIIVSRQVSYIQSTNLGFDRDNLVYISVEGNLAQGYETFKNEALKLPGIKSISRSSNPPTTISNSTVYVDWEGKDPSTKVSFSDAAVGYDFVSTVKLSMVAGRDFSRDFATDTAGYVVNEEAVKRLGYSNPIGKPLTIWGAKGKIIGVIKDFHFSSLHDKIKPLILYCGEKAGDGMILVRTMPGKTKQALTSLEGICRQMNPNFQFTYTFSDDEYNKLYNSEQIVSKLSDGFAFLAIFISCLGLLGLAMFTAEQRVKEIGIRKVLGASVTSLFALLSAEFLWLVLIALLIAIPVASYAMNYWLQSFAYHTPVQWWIFALSAGLIILIALATVSLQAIRAALINPIKSLRSE
ncbi:ABC transporter permease [Mucilaginibacter sp. BJC16-A38]|uniref:ABC transporter permease n=1 Tax=Mucilaginibacter phenanthrenivorans TaxID=1234842 RepID=UPI0021571C00|nr:ABC transporter permease [Mucilaginibacter phenanthrenivorans]MCR8558759.1 ABC transporter permease [Mucilaginibacter phenanthrenivorans]